MSNYVLDKAYRVEAAEGVTAGRAVVRGTAANACNLPLESNAAGCLGITTHGQPRADRFVGVRRIGIASAIAAGPIAAGAQVCIADIDGRVAERAFPQFQIGSIGSNNALTFEWLQHELFSASMYLTIIQPADAESFDWLFQGGDLRITPTADGGGITMTAAQLKAAIEADALLSRLLRVTHTGASNGTGIVASASLTATNLAATMNPIGIAETAAGQADDLVDVFLTL